MRGFRWAVLSALAVIAIVPLQTRAADEPAPPVHLPRITTAIKVDGDLSDPGWREAVAVDLAFEINQSDNGPPPVKTVAFLGYDSQFFYVAFRCDDPDPKKIRASYADRDTVFSEQDFAGIFLDSRHDGRSALELFVNPRGIQDDGVTNDATGSEDFAPDLFWESAARITDTGWEMEMALPLSSLRYPKGDPQTWGILLYRNYPRDFRYQICNVRLPKGSNCTVCHEMDLTGITGLPSSNHFVVAPYITGKEVGEARNGPGSSFLNKPVEGDGGVDLKWNPNADTALDFTLNPDFSQVESDTAQITVNQRFALFYPEKRPFFMEGVDLLQTPISAVYTRTITSPRWGLRATGKVGSVAYTVLTAQDRGGGSVIIPGPQYSDFAPQDFGSLVTIARMRQDLGRSYWGFLVTDRENQGGSFNRVFGPDFQWRPNAVDQVTGQFLYSLTRTPDQPWNSDEWDGRKLSGGDLSLVYDHSAKVWRWNLQYKNVSSDFRADSGFVPQVGYQDGRARLSYNVYPDNFFSRVEPAAIVEQKWDRSGNPLQRQIYAGLNAEGKYSLYGELFYNSDQEAVGDKFLRADAVWAEASLSPSVVWSKLSFFALVGQQIDYAGGRVGNGGDLALNATVRPTDHLTLVLNTERQWLDISGKRLFTADTARLKATYNFSARAFLRAIAQWVETRYTPSLYAFPVPEREGGLAANILFAYKLNWQSVLYIGYGDNRTLSNKLGLQPVQREFFFKISYAFQK